MADYAGVQDASRDAASQKLRNLANIAITAFELLQTNNLGIAGATAALVHRSLTEIRGFADAPPAGAEHKPFAETHLARIDFDLLPDGYGKGVA